MTDIIKYLEVRRSGIINTTKFLKSMKYMIGTSFQYTQHSIRNLYGIEDATILHNRLLIMDCLGDIYAYDMSPQAECMLDDVLTPITSWTNDRTVKKHTLSNNCVQWGKCGLFFTVTGKSNTLITVDGTEFYELDRIHIPDAVFTTMHEPSPERDHHIAVASSLKSIAIIDLKTGNVALNGFKGHTTSVTALSWSQTDSDLIMTANTSEVLLWDLRSHKTPLHLGINMSPIVVPEIRFLDRTSVVVLCGLNRLVVWDILNCKSIREITGFNLKKSRKRCKYFIEMESKPVLLYLPSQHHVNVINLETGEFIKQLGPHVDIVNIAISNDRTKELMTFAKHEGFIWKPSGYMS
ncbi:uncharacterized protein LOC106664768 [Cimex lectularius]|uniref:WD repeat-containing protein 55 homolog n=1 Tax=Cimex lectularius TaxID=79782 RepID=A0A8I6RH63_CIMLE|nr:uncharacterized protein LOC106664768 [Cimex lectularius]XP_014246249.1 uncharacterized protein LOC106664768 [Cimex lectularius]